MRALALALVALAAACPIVSSEGEGEIGEGEGEGEGEAVFVGDVVVARSLFWTDPVLLDDPSFVGLRRLMEAAGDRMGAANAGTLWSSLLKSFATTTHSTRFGPAQLESDLRVSLGDDPAAWDLDDVAFKVTGVHVRLDLAGADDDGLAHCGELRASVASTDPLHRPFHLLFLFRIPDDDDGCAIVARRFAGLSLLDDDAFRLEARALIDEHLSRFLLVESVEFTVAPWEWRQWIPVGNDDAATAAALPQVFHNPPLFQQVDMGRAADDDGFRAELSAFVVDNADAFDARTLSIPERFRALSVRANAGVPWQPLELELPVDVVAAHPRLRSHVEIVGCAACHTADADFVHTREDRTVSHFYAEELKARRDWLQDLVENKGPARPPFGPLQAGFLVHP
ncbi:MAG: hypothetical protein Q8O67_24375 [Deltaproteobacteria bacterium]|nr:hypothetical protein [Deltaproteobacteria bacterium]